MADVGLLMVTAQREKFEADISRGGQVTVLVVWCFRI
jgi:translation elongation factor EF-1alpha